MWESDGVRKRVDEVQKQLQSSGGKSLPTHQHHLGDILYGGKMAITLVQYKEWYF